MTAARPTSCWPCGRLPASPGWTAEFAQHLDDDLALYFGLEYGARKINTYEGLVVPGLLQSDDYAITLFRDDPATPGIRQPKRLELRHRRQQRLLDDDPLILHALIGQPVVTQQIGGAVVLRDQLIHLLRLIEQLSSTLEVRIIPFEASPRGMVNGSTVHLLEFDSRHLPTSAWREAMTPIGITDEADMIDVLLTNLERGVSRRSQSRRLRVSPRTASEGARAEVTAQPCPSLCLTGGFGASVPLPQGEVT